jgi:hypothetical protein
MEYVVDICGQFILGRWSWYGRDVREPHREEHLILRISTIARIIVDLFVLIFLIIIPLIHFNINEWIQLYVSLQCTTLPHKVLLHTLCLLRDIPTHGLETGPPAAVADEPEKDDGPVGDG